MNKKGCVKVNKPIMSINNNNDSIWLQLRPNKKCLKVLDKAFTLSDDLEEFDSVVNGSDKYESILKSNYASLFLQDRGYVAYLIFEKLKIHLILRKVKEYEKYRDMILEAFKVTTRTK